MNVLGIDLAKRKFTMAAIPMGGTGRPTPAVMTVTTKIEDKVEAALYMGKRLRFYLEEVPPFMDVYALALEEPWGRFHDVGRDLGVVLGVLAANAADAGVVRIMGLSPDQWRGRLGLAIRAGKTMTAAGLKVETQQWVMAATSPADFFVEASSGYKLVGDTLGEHEADAIAIAWACRLELAGLAPGAA